MPFNSTLETFTLGLTDDINDLTGLEMVGVEVQVTFHFISGSEPEFTHESVRFDIRDSF